MLAANGEPAMVEWLEGFVSNFVQKPRGGDRYQIRSVAIGLCPLALVNTYYLAAMKNSVDEKVRSAAEKVSVFWPNQNDRGAHMNVSGVALLQYSQHVDEAMQLVRFLISDQAQQWYADANYEYPVVAGIPVPETLQHWGEFKADDLPLDQLGILNEKAVLLMDRAGWR